MNCHGVVSLYVRAWPRTARKSTSLADVGNTRSSTTLPGLQVDIDPGRLCLQFRSAAAVSNVRADLFCAIALILAAIGLYGLLSYMVAQRTLEIGLRMALGGQRFDVLGMIIRQGISFAFVGIGLGIASSIVVTRLLSGMLYGVRPSDPATSVATTGLLLLVSLAATAVPAWRREPRS